MRHINNIMDIDKILKNFQRKGYKVSYFDTAKEAAEYLNQSIDEKTVGFGDSKTLFDMKLFDLLSSHNEVIDPMHPVEGKDFNQTAKETLTTDVFLTSVNGAVTTGEMVNIDGTGNRVAGSLFGHEYAYFVFSVNKITDSIENAVKRARQIAAPQNSQRCAEKVPCLFDGKCHDCNSPNRICNDLMIYLHAPSYTPMSVEVVIIGEEMGV